MAFYQELDYYNTFILKRVCTPQTVDQCSKSSAVVDGGTGAGCGTGVWPINNAYAPPQTVNITDGSLTGYSAASTSIDRKSVV